MARFGCKRRRFNVGLECYTPIPLFLFNLNQLRILAPLETAQAVPSVPIKLDRSMTVPLCQIRGQMAFSSRSLVVPALPGLLSSVNFS